ncbi:MAG TPA: hypothetical protein VHZ03_01880 [Trebonia sp.]|jgi:hypothetical protein|nr:hypothetical protein [Trebonia sp.]
MGVDRYRVCELYAAGPDAEGSGSGYRLGDRLVLTARHVIEPALAGPGGRVLVRPVGVRRWLPAQVVEWENWEKADVALAVIGDEDWRAPAGESALLWGELAGSDPVPFAAVGFPWASVLPDQTRETAHVYGFIPPFGQLRRGLLDLDVSSPPPEGRLGGSPWAGTSGAGVIAGNRLVGVVIVEPARYRNRLVAVPAVRFLSEGDFRALLAAHGVPAEAAPVMAPGPAGPAEVSRYLKELIGQLNVDFWSQDDRLEGPELEPARIERRLAVSISGGRGKEQGEVDADDLAGRCARLVVLGGPGSGKTWLARRTARRCAEAALEALASGASLDKVELPLFTTYSRLLAEKGHVREAAVSSAIGEMRDLGGSRVTDALKAFFNERDAPTLLVIDGLDEASDPGERLRLVSSLPWRILLTSRPISWGKQRAKQLIVAEADPAHRVGTLQPLKFPDDVEPVITQWFAEDPAQGQALIAQIASRRDLRQGATVPLILAFYCIIGAGQPLPRTPHEVREEVVRHLLSGLWRGPGDEDAGLPARVAAILRNWAWTGARRDERTGIGTWDDEIPVSQTSMSQPDQVAVDHVATPMRRTPGLASSKTLRRFIHRSIREHLTADYVATQMDACQAADELLYHLWYDPDWEYAAPAALAMHPDRDQVLKELVCRAARSRRIPESLAGIDGCWELRRFLARVAAETCEADWAAESVSIIGRARMELAVNDLLGLPPAAGWPATNSQIRRESLAQLDAPAAAWAFEAWVLATALDRLELKDNDKARARDRVLDLMDAADPLDTRVLADALARLGLKQPEKRARGRVLDLLGHAAEYWEADALVDALVTLGSHPADMAQARARVLEVFDARHARELAGTLGKLDLDPFADLKGWTSHLVNAWYAPPAPPVDLSRVWAMMGAPMPGFYSSADDVLDYLEDATDPTSAHMLTELLVSLSRQPSVTDRARRRVLDLLDQVTGPQDARLLADALVMLDPEPRAKVRARTRVLNLLAAAAKPSDARILAEVQGWLGTEPPDLTSARRRVLDLLAAAAESTDALVAAGALRMLGTGDSDTARARARVLDLLRAGSPARDLAEILAKLGPVADDLVDWPSWETAPPPDLLSAARRNSPLQAWLDVLPALTGIPGAHTL